MCDMKNVKQTNKLKDTLKHVILFYSHHNKRLYCNGSHHKYP